MSRRHASVEALTRATRFLAAARDRHAVWTDFDTAIGASDDWVTAYVVANVAVWGPARRLADHALGRLYQERRRPLGWGYNGSVAPDSDSTAWGLLAAHALLRRPGIVVPSLVRALLAHQTESGGFATYAVSRVAPARGPGLRGEWFAPQPCVTALNVLALVSVGMDLRAAPLARAAAYLCDQAAGTPRSAWWGDAPYVAYHCARALHLLGARDAIGSRLLSAAVERAQPDGGWGSSVTGTSACFHTACGLQLLLLDPSARSREAAEHSVRWLLERQREDGAFPGGPLLFVPDDRPGQDRTSHDLRAVFTTATCIKALAQYVQQVVA